MPDCDPHSVNPQYIASRDITACESSGKSLMDPTQQEFRRGCKSQFSVRFVTNECIIASRNDSRDGRFIEPAIPEYSPCLSFTAFAVRFQSSLVLFPKLVGLFFPIELGFGFGTGFLEGSFRLVRRDGRNCLSHFVVVSFACRSRFDDLSLGCSNC
jgi:hypothetical protein